MNPKSPGKNIGLFSLTMLIVVTIANVRNLPMVALFGHKLIFFMMAATLFFLLPTSLLTAELTAQDSESSGIYAWTTAAFGERMGFIAIWIQWINTLAWYPTILSFIAGTLAYLVEPRWANNKLYLIITVLSSFWLMTFLSLTGTQLAVRFASLCGLVGLILPIIAIIVLALFWLHLHQPIALHFSLHHIIPPLQHLSSWTSVTAIMAAFLGIELASVHLNAVKKPRRNFPRAILLSSVIIIATLLFGALSMACVVPASQLSLVTGVMQYFTMTLKLLHLSGLVPIVCLLLIIGSFGSMINWMISPAQGLQQACAKGFLPKSLQATNRFNAPHRILLLQAGIVSITCLGFLLMPSVNGGYWLLTDLSTELYLIMYLILYLAAISLNHRKKESFIIPGGKKGITVTLFTGLIGILIALIVGFIPPQNIAVGSPEHYLLVFTAGLAILLIPSLLAITYRAARLRHPPKP